MVSTVEIMFLFFCPRSERFLLRQDPPLPSLVNWLSSLLLQQNIIQTGEYLFSLHINVFIRTVVLSLCLLSRLWTSCVIEKVVNITRIAIGAWFVCIDVTLNLYMRVIPFNFNIAHAFCIADFLNEVFSTSSGHCSKSARTLTKYMHVWLGRFPVSCLHYNVQLYLKMSERIIPREHIVYTLAFSLYIYLKSCIAHDY